jgi:hypothetical protein
LKKLTVAEQAQLAAIPKEALARMERVLARTYRGIHHCEGWRARRPFGEGVSVTHYAGMSTYDYDELTRLVVAAHDEAVRVDLIGASHGYIRIGLTPRLRDGSLYDSHPTIEAAIEKARR